MLRVIDDEHERPSSGSLGQCRDSVLQCREEVEVASNLVRAQEIREGAEWDRCRRVRRDDPLDRRVGTELGDGLSRQAALADAGWSGDHHPAAVASSERETYEVQLFGPSEEWPRLAHADSVERPAKNAYPNTRVA
jgi:hypothetical protein